MHTLPREYPALSGEQIDQVREEKGAVLLSQTVFKRLGGLVSGRWQARCKALVCSSFMGEREVGSDRCEKNAQVREGCGTKFTKSKKKVRCLRPGLLFLTRVWVARARARTKNS